MKRLIGRTVSYGAGYAKAVAGYFLHSDCAPGGPVSVAIEPTNLCNLRCPLCAAGADTLKRPKGNMRFDDFKLIIGKLPSSVQELYLWGQGEPFMAPDFLRMVHYASKKRFKTIVSTNGHFLQEPESVIESGLDRLIVSLDGIDRETYESYRVGGDYTRVVEGIKNVAAEIKTKGCGPVIEIQCLVNRRNINGLKAFKRQAYAIGANRVVLKSLQAVSMEGGTSYLPENTRYSRYKRNSDGELETDRAWFRKNRCLRLYYSFQVDWQGNVVPCCFDKDSTFIMGNILKETLSDIWNSHKYRSFRHQLNHNGKILPMCKDCTEGLKRLTIDV
ncbi:radical SAM/SPASM domain-containing protein [Candidatus Latescibacterota bacterium]